MVVMEDFNVEIGTKQTNEENSIIVNGAEIEKS